MRLLRLWAVAISVLALLPVGARAQSESASLSGFVTDPSGAAIVGAQVEITNAQTNASQSTMTNSDGLYLFANLHPGEYRLSVSKNGFKQAIRQGLALHIQDTVSQNFKLEIGSATETVSVVANQLNINATDGTVSTLVDSTTVANMPLNGRSFQDLILLTPGVTTDSPQTGSRGGSIGQYGEFSVNGQRTESNYYTVDGVSANTSTSNATQGFVGSALTGSIGGSTALGTTQALVSVDDMQEFRVQTSTYSAEYGRSPGGQIALETKSGTNQWHGDAYDYLRNDAIGAATDYFTNYFSQPVSPLRQNDFGGALGGPVRIPGLYNGKDKTFFYVSYEGLRVTLPQPSTLFAVPDLCVRGLDPGTGPNSCAALGENAAPNNLQPILKSFPYPNFVASLGPLLGPSEAEFGESVATFSNTGSINATSVRLDQVVTNRMAFFFRFSDTNSNSVSLQSNGPQQEQSTPFLTRTYTVGVSNILSAQLSNELRFNHTSNDATPITTIVPFTDQAAPGGMGIGGTSKALNYTNYLNSQVPGLGLGPQSGALFLLSFNNFTETRQTVTDNLQREWNVVDTINYNLGSHQFKFGADYRRITPIIGVSNPFIQESFFTDLSQGRPGIEGGDMGQLSVNTAPPIYPLTVNFSAFAQDDWKVSPRFTLSLGLRWEVNPAPWVAQSTQGQYPYTCLCTGGVANENNWSLAPQGTRFWNTTWFNFAPRLGAAYQLRTTVGWETVLRGGFGIFYDTGQQDAYLAYQDSPGLVAGTLFQGPPPIPFPGTLSQLMPLSLSAPGAAASTAQSFGIVGFDPHLQLPYTLQWNFAVEQQLGKAQALTVTYLGSHGSRLLQSNQYTPGQNPNTGNSNNPNAPFFSLVSNGLTSDYGALQVQFQRRLSRGLTVLASYGWSHCIDYGSVNDFIGTYQRGNCDFDVRHNVSAAFSYDLPNVGGNGWIRAVLDHWGIDDRFTARTGMPVFLVGAPGIDPQTGQQIPAAFDVVQRVPQYLYGSNCLSTEQALGEISTSGAGTVTCPGGKAINFCAFAPTAQSVNDGATPYSQSACANLYPNAVVTNTLAPRNALLGFREWQMNLAVRREFPIHERFKLQFRAEAFNVFNHTNFGTINTESSLQFGLATRTLASSLPTLSSVYQTGGPRVMQFALKLIF